MIRKINAKVNIGLYVTERRPDGYHNLESLFIPVGVRNGTPECPFPFCDIMEIVECQDEASDHEFSFSGNPVDCPLEKNLVVKALRGFEKAFAEKCGREMPKFRVFLEKHIPDGAGLGGGSADASFTLLMLNELNGFPFSREELISIAATLGADCPFFIINRPCVAGGIGERLEETDLDLSGKWMLLLKPGHGVSTREAFGGIVPHAAESATDFPTTHHIGEWPGNVLNHFESHLFGLYPDIELLKDALYGEGAEFALMSGSGSAVYGIFPNLHAAEKAMKSICGDSDIYRALILL